MGTRADLQGKAALVTGASRGIGRAIALELARAGANIALNFKENVAAARAVAAEIEGLGRNAILLPADLADPAESERMAQGIMEVAGAFDEEPGFERR